MFVERLREAEGELTEARAAEDWVTLKSIAHTLKGSGSSFGYPQITEAALATEKVLLANAHSEIDPPLQQLLDTIHTIIDT